MSGVHSQRMQFHDCLTSHRDKLDRSLAPSTNSGEKRDATAKEVMHKSRVIKTNFAQVCRARINAIEFYMPPGRIYAITFKQRHLEYEYQPHVTLQQ